MAEGEWRTIPYLVQRYWAADDQQLFEALDYYNDDIIGTLHKGDVVATPVRSKENRDTVHATDEIEYEIYCAPSTFPDMACGNQREQNEGIFYEKQNKGITMLHIWDVKLQYGSEDHVKYNWKLDEATKECMLEIDQSDKNELGKKTVKFSFATNDTDKLLSQVVDGYEMKYMLRTDAIRLRIELEIVLSTPHTMPDFNSVRGQIMLQTELDGKPRTIIDLLHDQPPSKKPKFDHSNNTFKFSFIRIIPRNLHPFNDSSWLKLTVVLKDSTSTLDVDNYMVIFPYNITVDQRDYIHFKNGYIRFNVFWGCCLRQGKGLCTGVCTCEPGEFLDFLSPGKASCSRTNEE